MNTFADPAYEALFQWGLYTLNPADPSISLKAPGFNPEPIK
jgi:hypothetical protein